MSNQSDPTSSLTASPDATEAAFYEAMRRGDLGALMACWADDEDVVCVHPGGPRLIGTVAIRKAFDAMFVRGSIQIRPERVSKIELFASEVHSVRERIMVPTEAGQREVHVIATNIYHNTAQGWRMVLHHASPDAAPRAHDRVDSPRVIH